jgi:hypothetical protein
MRFAGKTITTERAYRIEKVRRRYLRGETLENIARQMEVSKLAIENDVELIMTDLLDHSKVSPEQRAKAMGVMMARAEEMYRASWEALTASQGESMETRVTSEIDEVDEEYEENGETKTRKKQVPGKPKSTLIRKKQAGDPRWMERAGWAWQKLCELHGLLERAKNDTGSTAAPTTGETGVILYMPANGRDMHLQTNVSKKDETKKT